MVPEPERTTATLASGILTPSLSTFEATRARYSPLLKASRMALRSRVRVRWVMAGTRKVREI